VLSVGYGHRHLKIGSTRHFDSTAPSLKSFVAQRKARREGLRPGSVDHVASSGGLCGPLSEQRRAAGVIGHAAAVAWRGRSIRTVTGRFIRTVTGRLILTVTGRFIRTVTGRLILTVTGRLILTATGRLILTVTGTFI
jgi:hypothetical protein